MTKRKHGRTVPPAPGGWQQWSQTILQAAAVAAKEAAWTTPTLTQFRQVTNYLFREQFLQFEGPMPTFGEAGHRADADQRTFLRKVIEVIEVFQRERESPLTLLSDEEIVEAREALDAMTLLVSPRGLVWPSAKHPDYARAAGARTAGHGDLEGI